MPPSTNNGARITSMQCYMETDIRYQCMLSVKKPQKPDRFRAMTMAMVSGWQLQNTNKLANSNVQHRQSWSHSTSSNTKTLNPEPQQGTPKQPSKYDRLTLAQKVDIIVNDDIQWLKLQQSLRDADGLWTSLGVQQVLNDHVQRRIEEMEQLEFAMSELNGPSTTVNDDKKEEPSTVVGTLTQFARKQFSRGAPTQRIQQERRDVSQSNLLVRGQQERKDTQSKTRRRVTMGF